MTDPRRPDYSIVDDDDVAGHSRDPAGVQPSQDDADVRGHAVSARPAVRDGGGDDVEGHVYVRTEDQSRET
jgi:hypothetical protein